MTFRPYLLFAGNCRAAFTRYQEIFGGEPFFMTLGEMPADAGGPPPGANADAILHAALTVGDQLLMGSDDPAGSFDGKVDGMSVAYSTADVAEANRVFAALAEGGEMQLPIGPTFFSPAFGMCTDGFGTPWMVMADQPQG
jgi:PhnB protein